MTSELPIRRITAIAMAGVLALLGFTDAHARDTAQSPASPNDAALVERIKREVVRELIRIYERTRSNGNGFPLDGLVPLAEEIGLDGAAFRDCVESGRYAARVQEDHDDGIAAGISGTPGNILRNNATGEAVARPGAAPIAAFKQIVDRLLETAR